MMRLLSHLRRRAARWERGQRTQVGRALSHLGVAHIEAYSPQASGRSERLFQTLQDRLPKELALAGITTMDAANAWLRDSYIPAHNAGSRCGEKVALGAQWHWEHRIVRRLGIIEAPIMHSPFPSASMHDEPTTDLLRTLCRPPGRQLAFERTASVMRMPKRPDLVTGLGFVRAGRPKGSAGIFIEDRTNERQGEVRPRIFGGPFVAALFADGRQVRGIEPCRGSPSRSRATRVQWGTEIAGKVKAWRRP